MTTGTGPRGVHRYLVTAPTALGMDTETYELVLGKPGTGWEK